METITKTGRPGRSWMGTAGLLVVGLLAGLAIGATGVASRSGPSASEALADPSPGLPPGIVQVGEEAQENAGVQIVAAEEGVLPVTLRVTGSVSPVESGVAHVRSLARGVIERVSVTLGQRVSQGDPLVTIDNIELGELVGDYLSESAALRQAGATLGVRRRELERAEALITIEAIAQQELDLRRAESENARAALDSQEARVARVEEQLHRFGLSDADIAALRPTDESGGHREASHSVLRAPFSGVITAFDVAAGELVDPEDELFTITDLSEVWVLADVYEKDLTKVGSGRDVTVTVDAYPDRRFAGRLTYVSDLIDPQTRTATVRCVVDNRDGALKLDMFAQVTIPAGQSRTAIIVPIDAVQTIDNQSVVFIRRSADRFERRDVVTGATAGTLVEIVSGLVAGDEIVAAGSFYLKTALLQERIGDEH